MKGHKERNAQRPGNWQYLNAGWTEMRMNQMCTRTPGSWSTIAARFVPKEQPGLGIAIRCDSARG